MTILDLNALIEQFGPAALKEKAGGLEWDQAAIDAISIGTAERRNSTLRKWLESYNVFQGFKADRRNAVSQAILNWADRQSHDSSLESLESLLEAHHALEHACVEAFGKERDFTSLASKALWLCYPKDVPLYDSFVLRALQVISKIEPSLPPVKYRVVGYAPFARLWRALYDRHEAAIDAISSDSGYPYSVRIFDGILWILGAPAYTVTHALGERG